MNEMGKAAMAVIYWMACETHGLAWMCVHTFEPGTRQRCR